MSAYQKSSIHKESHTNQSCRWDLFCYGGDPNKLSLLKIFHIRIEGGITPRRCEINGASPRNNNGEARVEIRVGVTHGASLVWCNIIGEESKSSHRRIGSLLRERVIAIYLSDIRDYEILTHYTGCLVVSDSGHRKENLSYKRTRWVYKITRRFLSVRQSAL